VPLSTLPCPCLPQVLWDVRPLGLTGDLLQSLLDAAAVTVNKNSLAGDGALGLSAARPGGVRLGAGALTARGLTERHFDAVADLLHRAASIASACHSECSRAAGRATTGSGAGSGSGSCGSAASGAPTLRAFLGLLGAAEEAGGFRGAVAALRADAEALAGAFPMPGQPLEGGPCPEGLGSEKQEGRLPSMGHQSTLMV